MTTPMNGKPKAQRSPQGVSKPIASTQELKESEKKMENLLREFKQWKTKVVKLNEMITGLKVQIKKLKWNVPKIKAKKRMPQVRVPV